MKQKAVEWLIEQVKSKEWQDKFIWHKEEVFQEAKAMEKEQIVNAFNGEPHCDGDGDRYYNETFNQNQTSK